MLYHALQRVAQRYPDNPALINDDRSLSFALLWHASMRVADCLSSLGVRQGDRVCLLSPNSIDAVVTFWAVAQCNAISVYLNEQTPEDGLLHIIEDAAPVFIFATEKLGSAQLTQYVMQQAGDVVRAEPVSKLQPAELQLVDLQSLIDLSDTGQGTSSNAKCSTSLVNSDYADTDFAEKYERSIDPNLVATIVYTSGSTGKPKGVSLTHRNLEAVGGMAADAYGTTSDDTYLMVVPLHYIHGLMILMTMHLRGAGIHFMNSFMFPKLVTKKLQDTGVTCFSGVPFHFTALIERGGFLDAALPDLRWVGVTGGTCAPERLKQMREAQPDIEIHISYGQTECSPRITALEPHKIDSKAESVGNVANGLDVQFLDDGGEPVATGELGELVVSGPTVMHGYWNDPENTARVIDSQGRLHTGDLAYMDSDGDVFIKGRLQAMIKSAGERIFPEELEAVLNQSPLIVDAAVVGVPDKLYGQVVEAHVILNPDTDESLDAVRKHCLEQVAFARSPKNYHRWDAFPLKANGKTDKHRLIAGRVDQ